MIIPFCKKNRFSQFAMATESATEILSIDETKEGEAADNTKNGMDNCEDGGAAILALELHNNFRLKHGVAPLKLDLNLCAQARDYAQSIANGLKPTTLNNSGLGWSVYDIQTSGPRYEGRQVSPGDAVSEAVTSWYSHHKDYNWRTPSSSPQKAKLFSQLVWKSSENLGVGVASTRQGGGKSYTVVAALYVPAGNLKSDQSYMDNVLRAQRVRTRE